MYHTASGFPTSGDDVFRRCHHPVGGRTSGCLSGQDYYDQSNGDLPVDLLVVLGRVCFCDSDLCNDEDIPQEPIGKSVL